MARANQNTFTVVGQIASIENNEFGGKKYKNFEVLVSETERCFFSVVEDRFPDNAKFMSTVEVTGGLRGSSRAKKANSGNSYVATQTTPVVLEVKILPYPAFPPI